MILDEGQLVVINDREGVVLNIISYNSRIYANVAYKIKEEYEYYYYDVKKEDNKLLFNEVKELDLLEDLTYKFLENSILGDNEE